MAQRKNTTYTELEAKLKEVNCKECNGSGECNDAEPGDISCKIWKCIECDGTGVKKGKIVILAVENEPS